MAEINIPAGPLTEAPWGAIRVDRPRELAVDAYTTAIRTALDGIELGEYDRCIVAWLVAFGDVPTVATICAWLHRVRAAATAGRIVLDEPAELGVPWHDGEDLFALTTRGVVMFPGAADEYVLSSEEPREWAAHLAAMADALDAAQGGDAR